MPVVELLHSTVRAWHLVHIRTCGNSGATMHLRSSISMRPMACSKPTVQVSQGLHGARFTTLAASINRLSCARLQQQCSRWHTRLATPAAAAVQGEQDVSAALVIETDDMACLALQQSVYMCSCHRAKYMAASESSYTLPPTMSCQQATL